MFGSYVIYFNHEGNNRSPVAIREGSASALPLFEYADMSNVKGDRIPLPNVTPRFSTIGLSTSELFGI